MADRLEAPAHAGGLEGAARVGEAAASGRMVRVGLFPDGRARFRATTCASLIAFADAACEALEAGIVPAALDAEAVRALVPGVHPDHQDRADLVAAAIAATSPQEEP